MGASAAYAINIPFRKALDGSAELGLQLPTAELPTDLPAAGEAASVERNLQGTVVLFPAGVEGLQDSLSRLGWMPHFNLC